MPARRRIPHTPSSNGRKPSVLLVDDHRQVLDGVSALLAEDFDVVGVATDGLQAIDKATELNPDVIVIDIQMPRLNGFQTLGALRRGGSRTPVVFLSMFDADDVVSEALRYGGHGYVLKSHVGRDLVSALDQALLGRSFVPSLTPLLAADAHLQHVMQVYEDNDTFADGLAAVFDLALRRGDATCIIATKPVREGLRDRLRARGWNVDGASGHKRYLAIEAADALGRIMRNGMPDEARLAEIARELDEFRRTESTGTTSRLTIVGNMVVSLSEDGNTPAVIALESQWNRLTRDLPFLTICGYTTSCFHDGVPGLWPDTCTEHRALSHAKDV